MRALNNRGETQFKHAAGTLSLAFGPRRWCELMSRAHGVRCNAALDGSGAVSWICRKPSSTETVPNEFAWYFVTSVRLARARSRGYKAVGSVSDARYAVHMSRGCFLHRKHAQRRTSF